MSAAVGTVNIIHGEATFIQRAADAGCARTCRPHGADAGRHAGTEIADRLYWPGPSATLVRIGTCWHGKAACRIAPTTPTRISQSPLNGGARP